MLNLDSPQLDWVALANGMGVTATRAVNLAQLQTQLQQAFAGDGPHLIEAVV